MEPSWPLFFSIADRPALFEVDLDGSGAAPEVRLTARRAGSEVGHLCLAGPDMLPGDGFSVVVPAAWMAPGTTFEVSAGDALRLMTPEELKLEMGASWSLLTMSARLFGTDPDEEPATFAQELSENWPVARLHVGRFPFVLDLPEIMLPPKGSRPPLAIDRKASSGDPYNNFDVINALRSIAKKIWSANALGNFSTVWIEARGLGGGVGGGAVAGGSGWNGAGVHELGHTANMPHWGSTSSYPYAGELGVGGGVGNTPALAGWEVVPAICPDGPDAGTERQDPMQRKSGGYCKRPGRGQDLWSDFSGKHLYRYFRGASKAAGEVPYNGQLVPYELGDASGRVHWPDPTARFWVRWSKDAKALVSIEELVSNEELRAAYPEALDTPVYTFVGSWWPAGTGYEEGAHMYAPWRYYGNLRHLFDLTDPGSFQELAQDRTYCQKACDLTLRVTWKDGSVTHHLLRGVEADAADGDGPTWWGINIPGEQELVQAELLRRPLVSKDPGKGLPGQNINDGATTPANVYDDAVVLASWQP